MQIQQESEEKQIQKELRDEIIGLILSKDLREYLLSKDADISDENLLKTIGAAPISLTKKKRLLSRCMKDEETKKEVRQKAEKAFAEISEAFSRLWHMNPADILTAVQCYIINIGGFYLYTADSVLRDGVYSFRDFKSLKDYIETYNYYYESDQLDYFDMTYCKERNENPERDWKSLEREWIQPPYWFWKIFLTDIGNNDDEKITADYQFICSPQGEVQYLSSPDPSSILSGGSAVGYAPPTPYKPGDILQINCLPYAPENAYCLVTEKAENGNIWCLYPTLSGDIGIGEIVSGYYYENYSECMQYLPPLFCAEKYDGVLPDNCSFMKALSEKLFEHPELGGELNKKIDHYPIPYEGESAGFGKFFSLERYRCNEDDWHISAEAVL